MAVKAATIEDARLVCEPLQIEIVEYAGKFRDKSRVLCKICAHEWQTPIGNIKMGRGCPSCKKKAKVLYEEPVVSGNSGHSAATENDVDCEERSEFPAEDITRTQLAERLMELDDILLRMKAQITKPQNGVVWIDIGQGIEIVDCSRKEYLARCKVCNDEWQATLGCIVRFGCAYCRIEKWLSEPYTAEELDAAIQVVKDERDERAESAL